MSRLFIALAALATLLGAGRAAAEERAVPREAGPRNVLSFAPLGLPTGLLALEYERVVSDHVSLKLAPDLRVYRAPDGVRGFDAWSDGERLLGVSGGLRLFVLGRAPSGLWLEPEAGTVIKLDRQAGETRQAWAVPRLAGTLGVTGVVGGWLSLSAGAGVQLLGLAPLPNLRLSMGVAF